MHLFRDLDRRIASFDKKIDEVFRKNEACQRIAKIKGIGPKTATAIIAAIGNGSEFKNGRHPPLGSVSSPGSSQAGTARF